MQSFIASARWESRFSAYEHDPTKLDKEILREYRFLVDTNCRALTTFAPMPRKNLTGENLRLFTGLKLHSTTTFFFRPTFVPPPCLWWIGGFSLAGTNLTLGIVALRRARYVWVHLSRDRDRDRDRRRGRDGDAVGWIYCELMSKRRRKDWRTNRG